MDDTKQQNTMQQPTQGNTIVDFIKPQVPSTMPQQIVPTQQQAAMNTPVQPQQIPPPQPAGQGKKEFDPLPSLQTNSEIITPTETQIELEPEVENAGVETVKAEPVLSTQEELIGVTLAKEATPIAAEPEPEEKFPLSQAQAQQITKGQLFLKDSTNPMLWLAMLILRQFQILEKNKKEVK